MKKSKIINILLVICIMLSSVFMVSCDLFGTSSDEDDSADIPIEEMEEAPEEDPDDPTEKDYNNGIVFDEEAEGYEPKIVKKDQSEFIGEWEATSGNAHYLLGNVDLNIKEGGAWTGNITEENVQGTWTALDDGIGLKSKIFTCKLAFSSTDKLLLSYLPFEDSTESVTIVMTRKE